MDAPANMPRPPVSVLMTVYNGMPYLPEAVGSVLNQTWSDFQFVIVDDGSTDESWAYLQSLRDPRLILLQQTNQGTAAAANLGLKHIETTWVARMDADDVALPHRLERQMEFMRRHPQVGIVGTQIAPLGSHNVGSSLHLPTTHTAIFNSLMQGRHGMAHSSIMIRTELLKSLGGYWSLPQIDDWDMMLRMGEVSELANLDEVLSHYRVHEGSLNGANMLRMHRSIEFAIERARCRQAGRPEVSWSEYEATLANRPWTARWNEARHVHALTQYRLAVAEMQGSRPWRGRLRLLWSACCSPERTWQRMCRMLGLDRSAADPGRQPAAGSPG